MAYNPHRTQGVFSSSLVSGSCHDHFQSTECGDVTLCLDWASVFKPGGCAFGFYKTPAKKSQCSEPYWWGCGKFLFTVPGGHFSYKLETNCRTRSGTTSEVAPSWHLAELNQLLLKFFLVWVCSGLVHKVTITVSSHLQPPCCVQKTQFLEVTLWLSQFFYCFFCKDPWALWGKNVTRLSHWCHSPIYCSLHADQLRVSVFLLQEETSSVRADRHADLCISP